MPGFRPSRNRRIAIRRRSKWKLDELINSHKGAEDSLLDMEELEKEGMKKLRDEYERLTRKKRGGPENLDDK